MNRRHSSGAYQLNATWHSRSIRTQRAAEVRVSVGMNLPALLWPPVNAPAGLSAGPAALAGIAGGVHGSEAGRRQGEEGQRMLGHLLGNIFDAAGGTGVEQVPHVALVLVRTRRADRSSPVAAADVAAHPAEISGGRAGQPGSR